jgi:hypothetical protein
LLFFEDCFAGVRMYTPFDGKGKMVGHGCTKFLSSPWNQL